MSNNDDCQRQLQNLCLFVFSQMLLNCQRNIMAVTKLISLVLILSLGSLTLPSCQAARILCISYQFGSHMFMVHSVAESLIGQGHEVYTVFSDKMAVPKDLEAKGFKVIRYHTPDHSSITSAKKNTDDLLDVARGKVNVEHMVRLSKSAVDECNDMDNDAKLYQQLKDLSFDLAIIDIFPVSSCLLFHALKLDIPFVLVSHAPDIEMTRSPLLPSFKPVEISLYSDDMTFFERLRNTLLTVFINIPELNRLSGRIDIHLLEKYNKDPTITTWGGLARKAELFFLSRSIVIEYPMPFMPNMIALDCLTCKPGKPLSDPLKELADMSEGIIVFSLGSLVDNMPKDLVEIFVAAFAQRKETVFWRLKGKLPEGTTDNVIAQAWLPQNDLLAHPKAKLFITHSGNNGQHESVYHGIPMLAIPLFAEQPHNAARIAHHGFGLWIDIKSFTSEELVEKMNTIIDTPSFKEKTEKAGRIMKATDMEPRMKAVFWIEHVLKFGGDHLRSHALHMPWYSYYMIDILLFVQAVIILVITVILILCYVIYNKVFKVKLKEKHD